jgi:GT2 family glycosyltransferase
MTQYEIIIVDNNSQFDDAADLEHLGQKSHVKLIRLDKNVGFAKANNIAAQHASGKYLLLLNPDTLLIEDSITKVVEFRKSVCLPCIIGIKLLNADHTYQLCRVTFPVLSDYFFQAFFLNTLFKKSKLFNRVNYGFYSPDQIKIVDSIGGAFLFVEKEIYHKLRGLDEKYFMYSEELDFCYRARILKINTYYYPETSIIHFGGGSTKYNRAENHIELYKSLLLLVSKYRGAIYVTIFGIILIVSTFNRFILNFFLSMILSDRIKYREKSRLFLNTNIWLIKTVFT